MERSNFLRGKFVLEDLHCKIWHRERYLTKIILTSNHFKRQLKSLNLKLCRVLHVPSMWISSRYSTYIAKHAGRWTHCSVLNGFQSTVYSCLTESVPRLGSESNTALTRIKHLPRMNEWLIWFLLSRNMYYKDIFLHAKQGICIVHCYFWVPFIYASIYLCIYEAEIFVSSAKYVLLYSLCHCESVFLWNK